MQKEIEIDGCVEIPNEMTIDEFTCAFIEFIESKKNSGNNSAPASTPDKPQPVADDSSSDNEDYPF